MIHQLKTETEYFDAVVKGLKSFEVRKNDRDFQVGDFLALNELTPHECNLDHEHLPTGRCCLVEVSYILTDSNYVQDGYVVLGIRPCIIERSIDCPYISQQEINKYYAVPVYGNHQQNNIIEED